MTENEKIDPINEIAEIVEAWQNRDFEGVDFDTFEAAAFDMSCAVLRITSKEIIRP